MKIAIILVVGLILSGCMTGKYHTLNTIGNGYSSKQIANSTYHVSYVDKPLSDFEKINDFALLRAAEITLENGYYYFIIEDEKNNEKDLIFSRTYPDMAMPKAKSQLYINCFKNKPEGVSYDARQISDALRDEYQINAIGDVGV
ncbi:MAG: hypothetical protein HOH19_00805 [Kordiimonadaceae bacterium]|jgi:hypothetical protein|nr:hypothetical protein [Kordiimonadaceae bacterium]MBT6031088.1 hypothetical protein [Kordiimonadaceae bacterium]